MTAMEKRDLTVRYSITQFTYWASSTGAASFAAAYLLKQGMASGLVGVLLATAGVLSCLTQPVLASVADNAREFALKKLLLGMSAICCVCFGVQLLPGLPVMARGLLYVAGGWSSDAMVPLLNAMSVAFSQAGYPINYGAARGIGSAASAVSSLVIGAVLAQMGQAWMMLFLLGFRVLCMISLAGYPGIQKEAPAAREKDSGSVLVFLGRYRWYVSLCWESCSWGCSMP